MTYVMRTTLLSICAALCVTGIYATAMADDGGTFQQVKAKTFDKEKFVFPQDLRGTQLNILFLAMSSDRDNGQYQQGALLAWHAALDERGVFSDEVLPYHFPVLESPPWFVKGIIVGAMRDAYEGKVPPDQSGVLYVDDLAAFAAEAQLALDQKPTIVIASAAGPTRAAPLQVFKGEVSPEGVDAVAAAITARFAESLAENLAESVAE